MPPESSHPLFLPIDVAVAAVAAAVQSTVENPNPTTIMRGGSSENSVLVRQPEGKDVQNGISQKEEEEMKI